MQQKKFRFIISIILAFATFLLVACESKPISETLTSDSGIPIKAILIVQDGGQLTQGDLLSHPEVLTTNNFDDFKNAFEKLARSDIALWIDINTLGLVDAQWFREMPQMLYPVVLIGISDPWCAFVETIRIVELEGVGSYECSPPPGFSVNKQEGNGGNWRGYNQPPTIQAIFEVTNELLESK